MGGIFVTHHQSDDPNFELTPSEQRVDRAASSLAGTSEKSTQKSLASIVLGFELFVVFLAGLTVFGLRLVEPPELGIYGGIAVCVFIIITLGVMRRGMIGIWFGWALHLLYFVAGFILPATLFVSLVFTALWVYCMVKGAQIDRDRKAWYLEQE